MANVTVTTPNVTKVFSYRAEDIQQMLDYAADSMENGQSATQIEKEAWLARQYQVLMRQAVWKHAYNKATKAAAASVSAIPVTEV